MLSQYLICNTNGCCSDSPVLEREGRKFKHQTGHRMNKACNLPLAMIIRARGDATEVSTPTTGYCSRQLGQQQSSRQVNLPA